MKYHVYKNEMHYNPGRQFRFNEHAWPGIGITARTHALELRKLDFATPSWQLDMYNARGQPSGVLVVRFNAPPQDPRP